MRPTAPALSAFALVILTSSASAFITRLTPLREVLESQPLIFVAKVDALDPNKPSAVLTIGEDLKGKATFRRLPVNMSGDSDAKKHGHTAQMFKRLAKGQAIVVFAGQPKGQRLTAFAFTEGTWFQLLGQVDGEAVRWSFLHCEPYLRRTFKGTTAEMRQVVVDGLAGTKTPPEPDPKAAPGLGPEAPPEPAPQDKHSNRGRRSSGVLFGVIPTVAIGGPLAILAMLFPAIFGGVLLVLRRWLIFLTMVGINSTLLTIHAWKPWCSTATLWSTMTVVTALGAIWAVGKAWSQRRQEVVTPRRAERVLLWTMTVAGLALVAYLLSRSPASLLLGSPWREIVVLTCAFAAGALATLSMTHASQSTRQSEPQASPPPTALYLSPEPVTLTALALAMVLMPRPTTALAPEWSVDWTFDAGKPGFIASSPCLTNDRVYVGAAHGYGFDVSGAVYCLNRGNGEKIWSFDDGGNMVPVFSSPCLADDRLYIGEGFHQDRNCKLYCLDAATGAKLWDFATSSHTEATPCVAGGLVYCGAGDDGLYCLTADAGKVVWHFEGLHVDTNPTVLADRVYAGSGVGDIYNSPAIFCLDAGTGKEVWRIPVHLPVFGSPTVDGGRVFYGLGNGDFLTSADNPAGAVLCVDAATGRRLWQFDVPDGVHVRPAVGAGRVYFGARNHDVYCVSATDGQLIWHHTVGSPVVASPALHAGRVCFAATHGQLWCCHAETGDPVCAPFDVGDHAGKKPQLLSSPAVAGTDERLQIVIGTDLDNLVQKSAVVYCLSMGPR
jgi:outer membrane protein assembly factor BamB